MPIAPPPPLKSGLFGRGGAPKAPKATPTGAPPPKPPPGVRIEHRIGIQAPAEVIWEVISDLKSWEQWNTLYPKASGLIRIGGALQQTRLAAAQQPPPDNPTASGDGHHALIPSAVSEHRHGR